MSNQLTTPLTDEEYAELDALLASAPAGVARAMDVAALEGFLTALAIGPVAVPPQGWLPWVSDMEHGSAGMGLADAEAGRAVALILRHHQYMVTWMGKDPSSFEPIYECGEEWSAGRWCEGFLLGVKLNEALWSPLAAAQPAWFAPFARLGSAAGRALIEQDGDGDDWAAEVTPSVIRICAFFAPARRRAQAAADAAAAGARQPVTREIPKVGRNDPCFCGSGKKFKKCCAGADPAVATVD